MSFAVGWMNAMCVVLLLSGISDALAWGEPRVGEIPGRMSGIEYVSGGDVSLEVYRGKILLVYFGADWCPPCVSTSRPAVIKAHQKYKDQDFSVLYVNLDDNNSRGRRIEESKYFGFAIAMLRLSDCPPGSLVSCKKLSQGVLGDFGKAYALPFALLIDERGIARVKYERSGEIARNIDVDVNEIIRRR